MIDPRMGICSAQQPWLSSSPIEGQFYFKPGQMLVLNANGELHDLNVPWDGANCVESLQ